MFIKRAGHPVLADAHVADAHVASSFLSLRVLMRSHSRLSLSSVHAPVDHAMN